MKKGFTLIELLAVILILGIIALIAIPQVTNVIDNASKGAAETSAEHYVGAVNNLVALNKLDTDSSNDISDGEKGIQSITVDMQGEGPTSGTVYVYNGTVVEAELEVNGRDIVCKKNGKCTAIDKYVYYTKTYPSYNDMPSFEDINISDTIAERPDSNYYIKIGVSNDKLVNPQMCVYEANNEFCLNPGEYEISKKKILEKFGYDKSTWHINPSDGHWYNSTNSLQCILEDNNTACATRTYQINTGIHLGQINITYSSVGTCHISDKYIGCLTF